LWKPNRIDDGIEVDAARKVDADDVSKELKELKDLVVAQRAMCNKNSIVISRINIVIGVILAVNVLLVPLLVMKKVNAMCFVSYE